VLKLTGIYAVVWIYTVFPLNSAGAFIVSASSQTWRLLEAQRLLEAGVYHVKDPAAYFFSKLSDPALND